jgi:glycosyltransferase involved in cell wall biosynthesis
LVDDGSNDGSGEICDEYAKKDNRVKVLHKENGGVGSARNAGLDIASGAYIGWVDSDDIIEPDMFARLIAAGADVAACSLSTFRGGCKTVFNLGTKFFNGQLQILEYMAKTSYSSVLWNKLSRIELWNGLRFPECKVFDDEAIIFLVMSKATSLTLLDNVLYNYRLHKRSVMRSYLPVDGIPALKFACSSYTEAKARENEISKYLLIPVFHILSYCRSSRGCGKAEYNKVLSESAEAAELLKGRKAELISMTGPGFLGRLELEALLSGVFFIALFRVYARDFMYLRAALKPRAGVRGADCGKREFKANSYCSCYG